MMNDLSQIYVVTKNEIIKCVRGRKFLISLLIVSAVFLLITLLQFVLGQWDSITTVGSWVDTYLSTFPMVLTLVIALLSSIAIVSEFEERTALILFTRPVRRTSILVGKIISCTLIESMIILMYFVLIGIVGMVKIGSLPGEMLLSYAIAVMYVFAASGIAFVISAFLKKGSVCTIISLLLLLVIVPIISAMETTDGGENWYMIDQAGNTMYQCYPEYVDRYNETLDGIGEVMDSAAKILTGFTSDDIQASAAWLLSFVFTPEYLAMTPEQQAAIPPEDLVYYMNPEYLALDAETRYSMLYLTGFLNIGASEHITDMAKALEYLVDSPLLKPMEHPDIGRAMLVLLVWGIVGYFIAWIRFIRREF